jgi:hypothetical protein
MKLYGDILACRKQKVPRVYEAVMWTSPYLAIPPDSSCWEKGWKPTQIGIAFRPQLC